MFFMKRGFTILELLVASLLLGMLMTILTMIFSQSSVAWRTGTALVANLSDVRANIAEVRDEADNAYVWDGEMHRIIGLWDENGNLRTRAWDVGAEDKLENKAAYLENAPTTDSWNLSDFQTQVGGAKTGNSLKTYIINVKSRGPNGEPGDYDDIWSFPDDFLD